MSSIELIVCTSSLCQVAENVTTWQRTATKPLPLLIIGDGLDAYESASWLAEQDVLKGRLYTNRERVGPVGALQRGYELSDKRHDILAYIHDDVRIYERNWDQRVLKEFDDPTVGVVGFGGARGRRG